MKRTILLLGLLTMSAFHAKAQDIGACLLGTNADGKKCWVCVNQEDDVEKAGKIYTQATIEVRSCQDYFMNDAEVITAKYTVLIRQEDGKTFRYDEQTGTEVIVLDMTLEEGDEFVRPNGETLRVEQVETDTDGTKVIHLKDTESGMEDTWRSDIGSVKSGILQADDIAGVTILYYQDNQMFVNEKGRTKFYYPEMNNDDLKQMFYQTREWDKTVDGYEPVYNPTLSYCFEGDALHITGVKTMMTFFTDPQIVHCIQEDNRLYIDYSLDRNQLGMPMYGNSYCMIDIKIEGFKPGVYYIYNYGDRCWDNYDSGEQSVKGLEVVCEDVDYRPFIEEGKVWKVGQLFNDNTTARVQYYYFDGDTVIDGRKCKKMMCYTQCAEEYPLYDGSLSLLKPVAAFYENQREVYIAYHRDEPMEIDIEQRPLYDFGLDSKSSSLVFGDRGYGNECEVKAFSSGYRSTDRFKGKYIEYQIVEEDYSLGTWLEGVGSEYGPLQNGLLPVPTHFPEELMECRVGDEIIYHNPDIIDGVNPPDEETKKRIDFTHIQKPRPKAPRRETEADGNQLSGAYTLRLLDLDLGTMSDTYHVTITDDADETVYDKTVRAADVLALNIDISEWKAVTYTVTVESDEECYTGSFSLSDPTVIQSVPSRPTQGVTYDLMGRIVKNPVHGLFIRDGRKVMIR